MTQAFQLEKTLNIDTLLTSHEFVISFGIISIIN